MRAREDTEPALVWATEGWRCPFPDREDWEGGWGWGLRHWFRRYAYDIHKEMARQAAGHGAWISKERRG